jgi:anti-sigma B factor antagonist
MTTELAITLDTGHGYVVVELDGEMDLASVQPIRDRLMTIAATVPGIVILDLERVRFLDSTALGLFVAMHKMLDERGAQLVLINVDRVVGRPITLTAVDQVLTVHWADGPIEPGEREDLIRQVRDNVPEQAQSDPGSGFDGFDSPDGPVVAAD